MPPPDINGEQTSPKRRENFHLHCEYAAPWATTKGTRVASAASGIVVDFIREQKYSELTEGTQEPVLIVSVPCPACL
jgi:hypothetical protein